MQKNKFILALAFICSMGAVRVLAQANTATPRITAAADNSKLVVLSGTVHPLARQQNDRGLAPADLPMAHMLLVLQRSPQQEAALESLLAAQQDRNSPNYHKWLTPAQFGAEFGPADQDIQTITAWLQSQGFTVNDVPAGRTVIDFSGTAATVQAAFHTAIHQYVLPNGEQHWANSTNIEIPAALTPVVAGVRSLNNFFPKPLHHTAVRPAFTYSFGAACGLLTTNDCFDVTPADFGKIYNLPTTTWTGANETIAIVSDSDISATDLQQFRSISGLPAMTNNGPSSSAPTCTAGTPCFVQFVPSTSTDPGIQCPNPGAAYSPASCPNPSNSNEVEADIDVEWAGATAPGANIWLVSSADSGATFGGELSATYVVNCPTVSGACPVAVPANVLSDSYGSCEATLGAGGNTFYSSTWSQAETEGITVVVASGDSGSAGCDPNNGAAPQVAESGLAVNGTASTPNDVAVGGTDFNQATNPTQFWGPSTSNSTTGESALGYIPETTWNDSCTNALFGNTPISDCNSAANASFVFILGGGGGASSCVNAGCTAGYAKPSWQTGVTPADSVRDVPDISLFAGNGLVGSSYIMCEADMPGVVGAPGQEGAACSLTAQLPNFNSATSSFEEVGGTSAAAQAFAGVSALIDQQAGADQGNINPNLYTLAKTAGNTCTSAASPASSCVFYDVTSGTISQPCDAVTPSPNCTTSGGDAVGVLEAVPPTLAYDAGTGYDLATGLGSVNVENLLCMWPGGTVTCTASALLAAPTTITVGASVTFTATVTQQSGATIPTGTVNFLDGSTNIGNGSLTAGVATLSTTTLAVGSHSITAAYQGTSTFAPSTSAAVAVQVNPAPTPDFTVSASPSSQSVAPGASTSYTLTLTPQNGFNQAVTVSCSGAPTEATCTPASTSVTLNGTSASTDTINVTTTAPSLVVRVTPPFSGWRILATIGSFALFLLVADGFIRRSMSARRWVAAAGFAVLIVFAVAGCGGNKSSTPPPSGGTPAGTYTLTITGTAGATTHSTTVTLMVQ